MPPQQPSVGNRKQRPFYRITELPPETTKESLGQALHRLCLSTGEEQIIEWLSIAPDPNEREKYSIATVSFVNVPICLTECSDGSDKIVTLQINGKAYDVHVDNKFKGITTLDCHDPVGDLVAVPGLAGNAFGAWKSRTSPKMWLRDFLPEKVKNLRIMIYGYNADLVGPGAQSCNSLLDLGKAFRDSLIQARSQPDEIHRPLILVGHSAGGLVIEQALLEAASARENCDKNQYLHDSFIGAIFFGVPHRGLNTDFLDGIVKGQPNESLVRSLSNQSPELRRMHSEFTKLFNQRRYQLYSYYEKKVTQQSKRNSSDGQLQACDETAFFVLESSAMEAVPGQESHRQYPIDADHRNLNRFPKRTDQDFQKVAANIESLVEIARGMQEEQFSKTPADFGLRGSRDYYFLVPYQKNKQYIRRRILDNSISKLCKESKPVVLSGPNGSGKTQALLNLAFQNRGNRNILWVDGYTKERLLSGLVSIGNAVGILKDGVSYESISSAVQKWLKSDSSGKWLLVVNNLAYKERFVSRMMAVETGTLMVSTCFEEISRFLRKPPLECDKMTEEEARNMFLAYSHLRTNDPVFDERDIRIFSDLLDHSPLAITLAASFIRTTQTSMSKYMETYRETLKRQDVEREKPLLPSELKNLPTAAILAVCDISFAGVKGQLSSAADLLLLVSMLDSHNVSLDLLQSKAIKVVGLEKKRDFETALSVLVSFSFLVMREERRYRIHDLVVIWIREQLSRKKEHSTRISLSFVKELLLRPRPPNLVDYESHVRAVISHSNKIPKLAQRRMAIQLLFADFLYQSNRLDEAGKLNEACIKYCKESMKDEKAFALCAIQRAFIEQRSAEQANAERANNDRDEAISWFKKASDGFAKFFKNDPCTLDIFKRIAILSEAQGNYSDAIFYYDYAASLSQLAKNDSFAVEMMHCKSLAYDKQGQYDFAADAHTLACVKSVQTHGLRHLSTLEIQNDYASTLRKQGNFDDALGLLKDIYNTYEQTRGRNDPLTLNVLGNIMVIDDIQGRPSDYTWLLHLKGEFFDESRDSRLSILSTRSNYALHLSKTDRHKEAIKEAQQVREGYENLLGNHDPITLEAIANCAVIHGSMGEIEKAKDLYQHAYDSQRKFLGDDHPSTLKTLADRARMFVRQGWYDQALSDWSEVLKGCASKYGGTHQFTLNVENELGNTLELLGQCQREEAEPCLTAAAHRMLNVQVPPRLLEATRSNLILGEERSVQKKTSWKLRFNRKKK